MRKNTFDSSISSSSNYRNNWFHLIISSIVLGMTKTTITLTLTTTTMMMNINKIGMVHGRLEAAVILPHGDFAWDPNLADAIVQMNQDDENENDVNDDDDNNNNKQSDYHDDDRKHKQERRQQQQQQQQPKEVAKLIAQKARQVGRWLSTEIQPDIIFLSTPHGIAVNVNFGLYMGSTTKTTTMASGSALIGQDLLVVNNSNHHRHHHRHHKNNNNNNNYLLPNPYDITVTNIPMQLNLTNDLLSYLLSLQSTTTKQNDTKNNNHQHHQHHQETQFNVTGLHLSPDETRSIPLFWAEVIPLLFIPRQQVETARSTSTTTTTSSSSSTPNTQYMILSHPRRRLTEAIDMISELLQMGNDIREWMENRHPNIRFAVVISGDMSHTHESTGPYGYEPESILYDQAIGYWANGNTNHHTRTTTTTKMNPNNHHYHYNNDDNNNNDDDLCFNLKRQHALLETAKSLQPKAMSCGFTGMVLLHGMLCGNPKSNYNNNNLNNQTTRKDMEKSFTSTKTTQTNNNSINFGPAFIKNGMMNSILSSTAWIPKQQQQQTTKNYRRGGRRRTTTTRDDQDPPRMDYYNNNNNNNNQILPSQKWKSRVLVNRNVTYYGMMVAQFWRLG